MLGSVQDSVCQWASVTKYSIVDLAISSMALAVFSRTQHHPHAASEAGEKYNKLLQTARLTLPDLVQRDVDAALVAVFLMSRYEDSMHAPKELESTIAFGSYSHHDGAAAILKLWQERSLDGIQGASEIIKHSRRGIVRSHILRHLALPTWLTDGAQFGEFGLELEYDRLLVGVASLRQHVKSLQQDMSQCQDITPSASSWAQTLNTEAATLSKALQDWSTRLPGTWCPRRLLIPAHIPLPTRHFFSSIVYSYSGLAYAAIWMNYFATSMLLNRARLRILELIQPSSQDLAHEQRRQEEECCSQIRAHASALAASIPFALDRFSVVAQTESVNTHRSDSVVLNTEEEIRPYLGNLAAWPLSLASSIAGLDSDLRNWYKSELQHVGGVVGVGVLSCAHASDWLDL